jgi:hypothetical protein
MDLKNQTGNVADCLQPLALIGWGAWMVDLAFPK